jgi:hypothetical protein
MTLGAFKLLLDVLLLACGIIYYVKFRAIKNEIDKITIIKNKKVRRVEAKPSRSGYLIDIVISICFLGYLVRVLLKDVFFYVLEIDSIYL